MSKSRLTFYPEPVHSNCLKISRFSSDIRFCRYISAKISFLSIKNDVDGK